MERDVSGLDLDMLVVQVAGQGHGAVLAPHVAVERQEVAATLAAGQAEEVAEVDAEVIDEIRGIRRVEIEHLPRRGGGPR